MMKKILLPTDFSEIAKYALEYAAFFAKRTRATLHIVTVFYLFLNAYIFLIAISTDTL